jgi:dTDP-4-amino-4,6-dideoxygalactose transaminase
LHAWHLFVVKTNYRDQLKNHLNSFGISSAINYPVILPLLEAYNYLNHSADDFPIAFSNQKQILSIPLFPEMTVHQHEHVIKSICLFEPTSC